MQQQPLPPRPKTAINELESFLSGLTKEDRDIILNSPDFAPILASFQDRFIFWLLLSDIGTEYITSSMNRQEIAESLKLRAHGIYANIKEKTQASLDALEKENQDMRRRIAELEGAK